MSLKRQMNNRQLLDSLDCIDERYVAELVTTMKLPKDKTADPNAKKNWFRSFKYAAAVAACALLLSAIVPILGMITGTLSAIPPLTDPFPSSQKTPSASASNSSEIGFYRKVARRTLDNGWVYTFTREGVKNGDDSEVFKYVFYGINVKYKYAEKYGGISSEDNLKTGWLLFGECSEAEKRDAELISSILSNEKTDEELLALNPDDYTFESLDKNMFFELMREALTAEPQAEGADQNYWDKPYFAFLQEKEFTDGYKFQISCLNETGLIDGLYIDVLYKTGAGDADYVQLSDLVASGEATAEQIEVFELIGAISDGIKGNTSYIYNCGSYRDKTIDGIDFSRLYKFLDDMHNNRFEEYNG